MAENQGALTPFALAVREAGVTVIPAATVLDFLAGATLTDLGNGVVGITVTAAGGVGPGTQDFLARFDATGTNVVDTNAKQAADAFSPALGDRVVMLGRFGVGSVPGLGSGRMMMTLEDVTATKDWGRGINVGLVLSRGGGWTGGMEAVKTEISATDNVGGASVRGFITANSVDGVGKILNMAGILLQDGWGDWSGAGEPSGVGEYACIRANPFSGVNPADVAYFAVCDLTGFNATQLWGCYIEGATSYFGALAVGNAAAASVIPVAGLVQKIEVFDGAGASLGFIPVYSAIA